VVHLRSTAGCNQVDVVVTGIGDSNKTPLLAIGEAKWGEVMGRDHAERLRQIRSLLAAQGRYDTSQTKFLCFSAAGFKDSLRREAAVDGDLILVATDEVYGG
jgi:hypothetical protein